jgi:hypothetical protein
MAYSRTTLEVRTGSTPSLPQAADESFSVDSGILSALTKFILLAVDDAGISITPTAIPAQVIIQNLGENTVTAIFDTTGTSAAELIIPAGKFVVLTDVQDSADIDIICDTSETSQVTVLIEYDIT